MRKVQGVSIPRSGHHLMMEYLLRYFSRDLSTSLLLNDGLAKAGSLVYCESYFHCHQTPCPYSATNFQKCHDFDSSIQYQPGQFYLVQTRNPLPAIISNYKLVVKLKLRQESVFSWRRFFRKSLKEWVRFQRKWVYPNHPNVFVLRYDELTAQPQVIFREIISFLDPQHIIDESWYQQVVDSIEVFSKDTVTTFKYYSDRLQNKADSAIKRSKLYCAA